MNNCATLSFCSLIITLSGVNPISNLISKFSKTIDIWTSESIPITFYTNSQHQRYDLTEMPFYISVTNNLHQGYCDKGLRNYSGILLVSISSVADVINILSELTDIEPSCNQMGVYPKVFLVLDATHCSASNESFMPTYSPFGKVKSEIASAFQDWNFSVDTDVYIAISPDIDEPAGMRLLEIYRIMNHSVVQEVEFSQDFKGFTLEGLSSRNRRLNFYGQAIRSIIYKDATSPRYNVTFQMSVDSFQDMVLILNFSFTFVYGDSWIRFDTNGRAQGVAKLLENSDGDVLGQAHELSVERQSRFDFIYPNFRFQETIFFRQPATFYPNLIFQPYSLNAWIAFSLSFFVLSICIGFVTTFTESARALRKHNILFNVFGLFCQQGWLENPASTLEYTASMKSTIVAGFILSTFFYNLYAASIISIISRREPPIKSAEQLLQTEVKIFVDIDARNAHRYLDKLPNHEKPAAVKNSEDGISMIVQNLSASVAFISYKHYVLKTVAVQKQLTFEKFCKSITQAGLDSKGLHVHNGMYVKKHSPLRKLFLHAQIRRAEIGAVKHQQLKYTKSTSPECLQTKEDVESLDMAVVSPVFILSFSIALFAFFVLIFEIVIVFATTYIHKIYEIDSFKNHHKLLYIK